MSTKSKVLVAAVILAALLFGVRLYKPHLMDFIIEPALPNCFRGWALSPAPGHDCGGVGCDKKSCPGGDQGGIDYYVTGPAKTCTRSAGLIVNLHGRTMTAREMWDITDLAQKGSDACYHVVHGEHRNPAGELEWTVTNAPEGIGELLVNDMKLVYNQAVYDIASLRRVLAQDGKLPDTYVTGFSQGGLMTWFLGCNSSEVLNIKAIAPLGYSMVREDFCDGLPDDVHVLYGHGRCDNGNLHGDTRGEGRCDALDRAGGQSFFKPVCSSVVWCRRSGRCDHEFRARPGKKALVFLNHSFSSERLTNHCIPAPGNPSGFACAQEGCPGTPVDWGTEVIRFFQDPMNYADRLQPGSR